MNLIRKTIKEALKTPGFSLLYIIGVAMAIAFTMIYGILLYGQLGPVYPEYDRDATIYLGGVKIKNGDNNINANFSKRFVDDYLRDNLKSANLITTKISYNPQSPKIQTDGRGPDFNVMLRKVDPSFFELYKYTFLAGTPFTQTDFDSKLRTAAISDKVASRLFDSPEEAIGKYIKIDRIKYRVSGVFREGNALSVDSYGEVFIPYYFDGAFYGDWPEGLAGGLAVTVKVKPGKKDQLIKELTDICRRINAIDTTAGKVYIPQIETHREHVLSDHDYEIDEKSFTVQEGPSPFSLWKPMIIALLIVLVIPALNISGLIGSRMDRLTPEIGIRRSFGATRRRLMLMVMTENLVLTIIGGFIGLIAAWTILVFARDFLLQFTPLGYINDPQFGDSASFMTGEMAFAPIIFIGAFMVCIILNTLSAWIPARRAIRRQITESINKKR